MAASRHNAAAEAGTLRSRADGLK